MPGFFLHGLFSTGSGMFCLVISLVDHAYLAAH